MLTFVLKGLFLSYIKHVKIKDEKKDFMKYFIEGASINLFVRWHEMIDEPSFHDEQINKSHPRTKDECKYF